MKVVKLALISVTVSLLIAGCKPGLDPSEDSDSPVVSISAPSNNSTVSDSVLVQVFAADEGGVAQVQLYVNGLTVLTRRTVPWHFIWTTGDVANKTAHTLTAGAVDPAGNVGFSAPVVVTVSRPEVGLQFDGIGDYIRLPSSSSLTTFGYHMTIEAWTRLDSYGSGAMVLASGNENEYALAVRFGGAVQVTMAHLNDQAGVELISQSILSLNTWYHLAARYDSTSVTIFINGIADASVSAAGTISTNLIEDNLSIGVHSSSDHTFHSNFLQGTLDEIRIWNTARPVSDIQQASGSELEGTEAGLVGYWKLNGNAVDASVQANHGTIIGSPQTVPVN